MSETTYHDKGPGVPVSWDLQSLTSAQWIRIDGLFDQGSDITNLPESMAESLGVDLSREEKITLGTVGGKIQGYVLDMEYQFSGLTFRGPVIFRSDTSGPLLGISPIKSYFNIFFDNQNSIVQFIPLHQSTVQQPLNASQALSSIMWLRRVIAYGVSTMLGRKWDEQ